MIIIVSRLRERFQVRRMGYFLGQTMNINIHENLVTGF